MFILKGNPTTKKNSQEIRYKYIGRKQVPFIAQNDNYTAYETACIWQLKTQRQTLPSPPYNVKCVYYRANRIRCDLTNLLEATDDILVRAGILPDDYFGIIAAHDGSRVFFDKNNPRVEITITSLK